MSSVRVPEAAVLEFLMTKLDLKILLRQKDEQRAHSAEKSIVES